MIILFTPFPTLWLCFQSTVNQDVAIEISLPNSRKIKKHKRLMRAPPLPAGSFVQPVQVDHSTRSLSVDGRPFNGVGECQAHSSSSAFTEAFSLTTLRNVSDASPRLVYERAERLRGRQPWLRWLQ